MGTLAKTQSVIKGWRMEFGGSRDEKLELSVKDGPSGEKELGIGEIDLGEVVMRETVKGVAMAMDEGSDEAVEGKRGKKKKTRESAREEEGGKEIESEAAPAKRPKKKRKKRGDAFDDMFAGLI